MNQIGAFQADVWNLPMSPRVQNLYELNKLVPVNADLGVGMGYRAFGPLAVHFGKRIERLYWRADSSRHPLALGIELADGVHVRIGDGGDTTIPTASTPSSKEYPAEFDDIMLSVG